MQTDLISHPRNAARFIETVRTRAPRGFSEAVKRAAEAHRLSTSEFMRRALAGAIEQSDAGAEFSRNPDSLAGAASNVTGGGGE